MTRPLALRLSLCALALAATSCASDGEPSASSTTVAAADVATSASASTIELADPVPVDAQERARTADAFVDAAEEHIRCGDADCWAEQATFDRLENLQSLALDIPGDDVAPLVDEIVLARQDWVACRKENGSRFDCRDVEASVETATRALHDFLHS